MKPGCISILVPNAVFFFSCPMQPILYWTFAVLSQHNIINNALTERNMWATVQKLFLCQRKYSDLSFLQQKNRRPHKPLPQPWTLCLPTAATFTGIYEMINNLKVQVVAQTNAEIIQMPTTIWRLSFIQAPLQCRFIVLAVNHAHTVHCSVSYCHLHITLTLLEFLWLLQPAVMLHTAQLFIAPCNEWYPTSLHWCIVIYDITQPTLIPSRSNFLSM